MQPAYSDRVIAFIDILGFSALVHRLNAEPALHAQLHRALTSIRRFKDSSIRKNTAQSELEISVFSDSIAISGNINSVHDVIWSAIHLQCELLALGILIRGGITYGRTVHTDDILYGEGMLDAYELESKAAIYPRLILAPKLIDKIKPQFSATFLSQDSDGLWFINPFSMGITPDHAEALLEDGYDPHEEALKTLGNLINQELLQLLDAGQLAKWGWLKT